jgi:hypothetical protein
MQKIVWCTQSRAFKTSPVSRQCSLLQWRPTRPSTTEIEGLHNCPSPGSRVKCRLGAVTISWGRSNAASTGQTHFQLPRWWLVGPVRGRTINKSGGYWQYRTLGAVYEIIFESVIDEPPPMH